MDDGLALVRLRAQDGHIDIEVVPVVPFQAGDGQDDFIVVFAPVVGIAVGLRAAPVHLQFEIRLLLGLAVIRPAGRPRDRIGIHRIGIVVNLLLRSRTNRSRAQVFHAVVPDKGALAFFGVIGEKLRACVFGTVYSSKLYVLGPVHQVDAHGVQDRRPYLGRDVGVVDMFQRHLLFNRDGRGHLGGKTTYIYGSAHADIRGLVIGNHGFSVHQEVVLNVVVFRFGKVGNDRDGGQFRKGCTVQGAAGGQFTGIIDDGIDRSAHIVRCRKDLPGFDPCDHQVESGLPPPFGIVDRIFLGVHPMVIDGIGVTGRGVSGIEEEVDGLDEILVEPCLTVCRFRFGKGGIFAPDGKHQAGVGDFKAGFGETSCHKEQGKKDQNMEPLTHLRSNSF